MLQVEVSVSSTSLTMCREDEPSGSSSTGIFFRVRMRWEMVWAVSRLSCQFLAPLASCLSRRTGVFLLLFGLSAPDSISSCGKGLDEPELACASASSGAASALGSPACAGPEWPASGKPERTACRGWRRHAWLRLCEATKSLERFEKERASLLFTTSRLCRVAELL